MDKTPSKTFDDQLRAAFEAGCRRGWHEAGISEGYQMRSAPDFDEWRPTLGDPGS